jgi:large subunit ribosomal protein L10
MSQYIKGLVQNELEKRFSGVPDFMVVSTVGLDGINNNILRGKLKTQGVRMTVVKNALMRRAMDGLGRSAAGSLFESGPCTVVYGADSVVDVAKELLDCCTKLKLKAVVVRGAFVDGQALDARNASELSKMPNRAEMHGRLAATALAPGAKVAGAIVASGSKIAGCLKSLIEKLEKAA